MEVADFVIHTAGTQLRDRISKKNLNRKDLVNIILKMKG